MSIDSIGPIAGPLRITAPTGPAGAEATGNAADVFGGLLTQNIETLQATQSKADGLAVKAATGDLQDAHDYMAASMEAALATQLTVAIRDKAVAAFTEIMRMQA
ncbi:flagellar hook-basal body complex protein FliE [Planomonospora sp. ID67723]|uniref:flagellar hook-basal body complex protein FliE n=1 Tax=Planomonospora sp. ID67723 TaxID=2738134 RepID=UPI0018C3DA74|nr:flagellar hook-basal body complex protein FliE [Planomonospora sp. ID67723]MBG0833315.1 flagellar hook-basal body complex protein FliE [Planomonospora sp. ID67723]